MWLSFSVYPAYSWVQDLPVDHPSRVSLFHLWVLWLPGSTAPIALHGHTCRVSLCIHTCGPHPLVGSRKAGVVSYTTLWPKCFMHSPLGSKWLFHPPTVFPNSGNGHLVLVIQVKKPGVIIYIYIYIIFFLSLPSCFGSWDRIKTLDRHHLNQRSSTLAAQ